MHFFLEFVKGYTKCKGKFESFFDILYLKVSSLFLGKQGKPLFKPDNYVAYFSFSYFSRIPAYFEC